MNFFSDLCYLQELTKYLMETSTMKPVQVINLRDFRLFNFQINQASTKVNHLAREEEHMKVFYVKFIELSMKFIIWKMKNSEYAIVAKSKNYIKSYN